MSSAAGTSRRDIAVARVLDSARSRAEIRLQRFLDAAVELLTSSPGKEFTVQEVVERSGQSLRSFYQYFDGKHELLLALFEDSVRSTTARLEVILAEETDPLDRLRRFVLEYHRLCRPVRTGKAQQGGLAPVLADFGQQLLSQHPEEAARAFAPLTAQFEALIREAQAAGVVREGLGGATAGIVLQAIMFHAYAQTISATPVAPDAADEAAELWDLFVRGLQSPVGAVR